MSFWAYILHCRAGVFYTGHTDDLERRVGEHKSGIIKGFTSKMLPVELVWAQEFETRFEAVAAERQIKGWSRKKKLALIRGDWDAISRLAKSKSCPSTGSGQTDFVLADTAREAMLAHAARAAPDEACGLLLGQRDHITEARPTANIAADPARYFEIDPQALIDAHRAARDGGPQLLGYYHSHPFGPAEPSATDQAQASGDGRVWAIVAEGEIRLWRDGDDGFVPLSYAPVDG